MMGSLTRINGGVCVVLMKVERRIDLVYGGGSVGLMGLVSQAVHDGGRHVLGYVPPLPLTLSLSQTQCLNDNCINGLCPSFIYSKGTLPEGRDHWIKCGSWLLLIVFVFLFMMLFYFSRKRGFLWTWFWPSRTLKACVRLVSEVANLKCLYMYLGAFGRL